MSILIATACAAGYTLEEATLSASFDDIELTAPTTTGTNANVTLTYTTSSPRTFSISFSGVGTLQYRVNSGTYTSGSSFSVATGDTLNFKYLNHTGIYESQTVTINDNTRGGSVGSFTVAYGL